MDYRWRCLDLGVTDWMPLRAQNQTQLLSELRTKIATIEARFGCYVLPRSTFYAEISAGECIQLYSIRRDVQVHYHIKLSGEHGQDV